MPQCHTHPPASPLCPPPSLLTVPRARQQRQQRRRGAGRRRARARRPRRPCSSLLPSQQWQRHGHGPARPLTNAKQPRGGGHVCSRLWWPGGQCTGALLLLSLPTAGWHVLCFCGQEAVLSVLSRSSRWGTDTCFPPAQPTRGHLHFPCSSLQMDPQQMMAMQAAYGYGQAGMMPGAAMMAPMPGQPCCCVMVCVLERFVSYKMLVPGAAMMAPMPGRDPLLDIYFVLEHSCCQFACAALLFEALPGWPDGAACCEATCHLLLPAWPTLQCHHFCRHHQTLPACPTGPCRHGVPRRSRRRHALWHGDAAVWIRAHSARPGARSFCFPAALGAMAGCAAPVQARVGCTAEGL